MFSAQMGGISVYIPKDILVALYSKPYVYSLKSSRDYNNSAKSILIFDIL